MSISYICNSAGLLAARLQLAPAFNCAATRRNRGCRRTRYCSQPGERRCGGGLDQQTFGRYIALGRVESPRRKPDRSGRSRPIAPPLQCTSWVPLIPRAMVLRSAWALAPLTRFSATWTGCSYPCACCSLQSFDRPRDPPQTPRQVLQTETPLAPPLALTQAGFDWRMVDLGRIQWSCDP
jgi:hypothetical protein